MFCYISYINGVIANFVLKFLNLRYHGNKGRSCVNFNEAVKLRTQKPLLDALGHSSYMSRIIVNFVLQFPHFRYHGSKGRIGLKKIFTSVLEAMFQIW